MNVLVASDLHSKKRALATLNSALKRFSNKLDLTCLCGDITTFEDGRKARKMLDSLDTKKPVLAIPGNCDPPSVLEGIDDSQAVNIHGKSYEFQGHVFIGYGGASSHNSYGSTTETAYKLLERLMASQPPSSTHLVLHAPVFGYVDDGHGNPGYRKLVEIYKPTSVFSGHIHEARGWTRNEHTFFVNPGPAAGGHFAVVEMTGEGARLVYRE